MGVRFTTGAIRCEADRHHVTLPRLGTIKTHESPRKLARRLEQGTERILAATVSQDAAGRWHVAFTCEVARQRAGQASTGSHPEAPFPQRGQNGQGAERETEAAPAADAAGDELSTPHAAGDQTGTASPQGEAA